MSTRAFEALLRSCRPTVDELKATYFEVLTAIAFKYFAEQQVDLAVIETGLGGRLDSTNIITPELSIITSIGLEHQDYLGKNLAEIAGEKAGIIKRHRPCISGVRQPQAAAVLAAACNKQRARLIETHKFMRISSTRYTQAGSEFHVKSERLGFDYAKVRTNLLGSHQVKNAALAIAAARLLHNAGFNLNERAVREGLAQTHWPARMQLVHGDPELLLDAAHNADGMRVLTQTLARLFPGRRVKIVLSLMNDKAVAPVLRPWQKLPAEFFFTAAATARARAASDLMQQARAMSLRGRAYDAAGQAFAAARESCRKNDLLCVAGSHYLIGELMQQGLLPYSY
ncbi:bifunctional folylpolyglutamate synthase/dihydrofolate synthase [candidate division KSB1 bacterium]|nr:MAG: bifunctional folylpolyglutamate synthase/dihydrofolate synthase [candidate division KSB1 bacterium]